MFSKRKFSFGAECLDNGVSFSLFAPDCQRVDLILNDQSYPLEKEKDNFFTCFVKKAKEGDHYHFLLDQKTKIADPASKSQPQGVFGPSEVINSTSYKWKDQNWTGIEALERQVIYEFHVGTFTKEGTYKAAIEKLPHLKELGVTIVEMMPVNCFAGRFGWGYDGIFLFAPYNGYGKPEELKAFIEEAHLLGIGVILDVVYNHFGPDLVLHKLISSCFFHQSQTTDWGDAIDYDGPCSKQVRDFFISNALYWLQDYHFDGLRFDATQDIHDRSEKNILKEIIENIRKQISKKVILIAENEPQESKLLKEYRFDAVWNDDFHHSIKVALTGRSEAYYKDYHGSPQEILSAIKYGYLYQGQYYSWQNKNRGSPSLDSQYENYVIYLENHDQIANFPMGLRLPDFCHPSLLRALTALFLLLPQTPLLFQGQEFGAKAPFNFFADHGHTLNPTVWAGRKKFMEQFPSFLSLDQTTDYADPSSYDTFEKCKLDWESFNQKTFELHKTVIDLRKTWPHPLKIDGSILNDKILLLRYFCENEDRLILCNFGSDCLMQSVSEPLFAPRCEKKWRLLLSSRDSRFGGNGTPPFKEGIWTMPAYTTYVLLEGNL